MSETTDEALLARIAGGDERAMEMLFDRHQSRLIAYAHARLRDRDAACEIMGDVMLEIWRKAGSFAGRSKPLTWIFGIANYKVLDLLRRAGRYRAEELDPEMPLEDSAASNPIALLDRERVARRLETCMGELSDAQRQVVHLAFFEDLGYGEIAEIADCPTGTVKTRMFHAKRALKECLERLAVGR
jgi:RNA polymerase sigma-70 factor (ECF subfamily)